MPRNVRNFWIELEVDGKKTKIATGPVAKDGGFQARILMRDNGQVTTAGYMTGKVTDTGSLELDWNGDTLNLTTR